MNVVQLYGEVRYMTVNEVFWVYAEKVFSQTQNRPDFTGKQLKNERFGSIGRGEVFQVQKLQKLWVQGRFLFI